MCIYSTSKLELFSLKMGCHLLCALLTESTGSHPQQPLEKMLGLPTNVLILENHSVWRVPEAALTQCHLEDIIPVQALPGPATLGVRLNEAEKAQGTGVEGETVKEVKK